MEQLNYRPDGVAGAVRQSSDQAVGTADAPNVQSSEPIREMNDSKLVGAQAAVSAGVSVSGGGFNSISAPVAGDSGTVKRKRGRPPRGQPPAKKIREDEEEDVCFICFDGGSLVLCDRRGCPKAYHPACIKRDEAFFQSKAKWNCGWHICSMCQKSAHHMCYTCTYSLCKGCIKKADYVCVRGDKGFCTICMKTIMLIENNVQGMEETPQVDFDDKTSWEYLFKVYWVYLKEKLSLTVDELTQAKNPWKGAGTVGFERISPEVRNGANDLKSLQNRANDLKSIQNRANDLKSLENGANDIKSLQYGASAHENLTLDISPENLEANNSKRRKTDEQLNLLHEATLLLERPCGESGTSLVGSKKWATSELLEFVAHMRNGDTSPLSQFDVQNLVLEYIEKNNLRDPRLKTQVLCDSRLYNLFRKPCVGHFEMLKLLESHFLVKEDSQKNIIGTVAKQVDPDWNNDSMLMLDKDKNRKPCRKGEEQAPQANLDEYAAIDVHNINLIYVRRDLVENLLEDSEKFHLKVVGSIVRISISSTNQKQDMYRLVQVVGTRKVDQPYKCGNRITNIVLEVLNLNKKETVSAESVSNQEFSEDECRHLRQSIRCGLVKQFTVGEILEKAVALQSVRFNDTPEERQHRLIEIPEVHADPKMNPDCASEEDAAELNNNKRGEYMKTRSSRNREKGAKSSSPQKRSEGSNETGDRQLYSEISIKAQGIQLNDINCYGSVTSASSLTMGNTTSANKGETDELWHYQDPHGRVQGPFSLMQLQKWSTTGYFPTDMKIWASRQENSVLLTDALKGEFHKALLQCNPSLQSDGGGASNIQQSENTFTQRVSYQIDGTHGCSPLPSSALSVSNVGNNENQSDSRSLSGQSSGQNQKALPVILGANNSNSDPGAAASVTKSTYVIEMNGAAVLSNLHNQTHKVSNDNLEGQVGQKDGHLSSVLPVRDSGILDLPSHEPKSSNNADTALNNQEKQSVPSKLVVQDSVPSWSTSSSLVVGGAQLAEIAHDWERFPPIPAKPSSGEWNPGLASVPSMKLPESTADRADTSKSNIDQLIHSSPSQQRASTMSWQAMVSEPIEFSTLAEESVSDLLAEVDAMESSQCGLPSPTSKRNFVDELFYGSIEEFSPIPDQGARSDGFSSSGDMHLPCQSTTLEVGPSHGIVFDFLKRSEVDGEAKSSPAPVSHENKVVTHDAPRTSSEGILTSLTGVEKENKIRVDLNNVPAIIQHGRSGTSVPDCSVRADEEEGEIKSIDMPIEHKKFPEYIQPTAPLIVSSNSVKPNTAVKARAKVTDIRNSTTIQQRGGNGRFKESVTGAEEDGKIKSTDISQPFQSAAPPLTRRQEQVNQNNTQRGLGSGKSTDTSQPIQSAAQPLTRHKEPVDQNNAQREGSGSGRQSHGNANPGSRGTVGAAGSQRKYSGDRYNGSPRDRGHNQSRGPWTRQSYGGAGGGGSGGGGGGHSRPSPKGRVCKFYESGRCKRGALCDYLHP